MVEVAQKLEFHSDRETPVPLPGTGKRVLFILNDPKFLITHRMNIVRAARDQGYDVHIATPEKPDADKIRAEKFPFHPLKMTRWGRNPFGELIAIFDFIRLYQKLRPDVVHHVTIKPVIYGSIAARICKVPRVVNAVSGRGQMFGSQNFLQRLQRSFITKLYRFALGHPNQTVIFQNPEDRSYFLEANIIPAEKTIRLMGAGVDLKLFSPEPETAPKRVVPVVLYNSRLLRQKGVCELVEAARILHQRGVKARYIIAGENAPGNPDSVSHEEIQDWKEEGVVELPGFCENIADLIRSSDICCLATYYNEGVPRALLDAAACAKPIVTTDSPGCHEVCINEKTGLFVKPRDAKDLANTLERLILDSELRQQLGKAGRKHMENGGFSDEDIVSQTLSLY